MAAYFNLFAAAAALYRPRLLFPCYPPAIIKAVEGAAHEAGKCRILAVDRLWEWLPLVLYGALSAVEGGTDGFWRLALTGYIQWMMVNLGDLLFLDVWLIQKKAKKPFCDPRHRGPPRLRVQSVDEGLCSAGASASVAVFYVPYPGGSPGRAGAAHQYVLVNCKKMCRIGIRFQIVRPVVKMMGDAFAQKLQEMGYQNV